MNELVPVNTNNMIVSKPFIFTHSGSCEFYVDETRIDIIETAKEDDRKRKSLYIHATRDCNDNYELHVRVNPTRVKQTINDSIVACVQVVEGIKDFFEPKTKEPPKSKKNEIIVVNNRPRKKKVTNKKQSK